MANRPAESAWKRAFDLLMPIEPERPLDVRLGEGVLSRATRIWRGFCLSLPFLFLDGVISYVARSVIVFAGLFVVAYLGAVVYALVEQRNEARKALRNVRQRTFDFKPVLEPVPWSTTVNGVPYEFESVAWVEVRNDGTTSEFTARALRITGVPEAWGSDYKVIAPLWEANHRSNIEIPGRGGIRRLQLASVLRNPRAFWFNTVIKEGEGGAGHQWVLDTDEAAEVGFVLEVVDTGADDEVIRKNGRIVVPADPGQATFALEDD